MVTLEQIKLLESKIVKAIGVVNQLTEENVRLKKRNDEMKERNGELEELVERLKDEKSKVEAGIVSALDRLNQFEDAIERSLAATKVAAPPEASSIVAHTVVESPFPAAPVNVETPLPAAAAPVAAAAQPPAAHAEDGLPSAYTVDEIEMEVEELDNADSDEAELDIF
jgi:uncharacterized phage infection (PIP) family protein YhgE